MTFPIAISLNDKFKTLFSIRRETMIHWTYGYKVAVLILLEKEPLLREALCNLKTLQIFLESERKLPIFLKRIRSILLGKPIPLIENIEANITLLEMQIRDIETEIEVAKSEIELLDHQYNVKNLTYDQVQSLSGESFSSKIAENAAIATWAFEHQLPEDVARALFDSQALPAIEQERFFSLMADKIIGVEKATLKFVSQQSQVGEFLTSQVNEIVGGSSR